MYECQVRWIVIIAIALGALIAAAVWVLRLPDTQVIESVRSPDRQWIARVEPAWFIGAA
jgi:HAMP domain-containing protein